MPQIQRDPSVDQSFPQASHERLAQGQGRLLPPFQRRYLFSSHEHLKLKGCDVESTGEMVLRVVEYGAMFISQQPSVKEAWVKCPASPETPLPFWMIV